jgi:hypothetical protein
MVVNRVVAEVAVTEVAVTVVEAVEAVKPAEAEAAVDEEVAATKTSEVEAAATEVEPMTSEAMEATKAMAAAETMATTETMPSATVASAATGISDLGHRDDHGDKHGVHQIEQLASHDTLLLQTVPPIHRRHRRASMMAKLRPGGSYLSQRPPAPGSRHDGGAGEAVLDHVPIGALPDQPLRRLDFESQGRPALNPRAGLIILCLGRRGKPGYCGGEHRQTRHPYAHGLSPVSARHGFPSWRRRQHPRHSFPKCWEKSGN